jgi:hypothetical protein
LDYHLTPQEVEPVLTLVTIAVPFLSSVARVGLGF